MADLSQPESWLYRMLPYMEEVYKQARGGRKYIDAAMDYDTLEIKLRAYDADSHFGVGGESEVRKAPWDDHDAMREALVSMAKEHPAPFDVWSYLDPNLVEI